MCVDVDGTLLRTDLLFESLLRLLKKSPLHLFVLPFWLLLGKARFKRKLTEVVSLEHAELPFNPELMTWLETEHANGREIVLCSASDETLVKQVAARIGFPVQVIGSNGIVNLKGSHKAQRLVQRFGAGRFDYAGNSRADLPVWSHARSAIVVDAPRSVRNAAHANGNVTLSFQSSGSRLRSIIKAIRAYQWVKNVLVFLPMITSHKLLEISLFANGLLAFACISLCASSIYIVNDLSDLDSDRKHHSKRKRPFASGALSIPTGIAMAVALFFGSVALSLFLPGVFTTILLSYACISSVYTFWLKRKLLADVLALAILYTVRIIAGGAATGILVSPWLLAFSLFFFISLAFSKRVTEMIRTPPNTRDSLAGRGYLLADLQIVGSLGASSGFLACLVLSLYISSKSVHELYANPDWLWLLLPLLLYLIGRLWVLTMRGQLSDDPILFVMRDPATYGVLIAGALIILAATKLSFGLPAIANQ